MAKTIKVEEIGELIGERPITMNWFAYDLGGNWGVKLSKTGRAKRNKGSVIQGINKDISIQKVMKLAKNGNFDEIAGFYPAIFLFFGKKFINKVDFCDKSGRNRISRLIDNLKGPKHLKDKIFEFLEQKFDFLAFLEACGRNEKLKFDLDSAISVYKLQGDDAIYGILCQIFYVNKGIDCLTVQLIDDLPIQLSIEISDFVSGCTFPVAVSPSISSLKWQNNENGYFLYGKLNEKWLCMDVVGTKSINLANYSLNNRLNYLGGGGECLPYVICWNWKEILEAYSYFKQNLLIRDLKNTIFNHYWFNFGKKSLINVEFQNNLVNCKSDFSFPINIDIDISTGKKHYITVQMDGKFIKYCDKENIVFSKSEIFDWFELASYL